MNLEAVKDATPVQYAPVLDQKSVIIQQQKTPAFNEEEEVMKARQELADLNLKKQRDSLVAEKITTKSDSLNLEAAEIVLSKKEISIENSRNTEKESKSLSALDTEKDAKAKEKELLKAKKKAEKEAALALAAREEEERALRKLEKLAALEEARKLKEAVEEARAKKNKEKEDEKVYFLDLIFLFRY